MTLWRSLANRPKHSPGCRRCGLELRFGFAGRSPVDLKLSLRLPFLFMLAAAVGALAAVSGRAASSFYEVEVAVADQSPASRRAAARAGLEMSLVRVTGLSALPSTPAVTEALSQPDQFYSRFLVVDDGRLRFFFTPAAILNLIDAAKLPIWPANRPEAIAWLVVEQDGAREIVQDGHPLAAALVQRARQRGFVLRMPLLDLQDRAQVQPGAIWGGATLPLVAASRRYKADVVLIGRLRQLPDASFSGRLLAWLRNAEFTADVSPLTLSEAGAQAADFLADGLASRYAIPWRAHQQVSLTVGGISSPLHYGALLRYLEGLEFLARTQVAALHQEQLHLIVDTRAEAAQLMELLQVDGRLARPAIGGAPNQLIWREI